MKQLFLIVAVVISIIHTGTAQQFKWVKGGGSTDYLSNGIVKGEWITNMCTDEKGNIYALSHVGEYNIKADTFHFTASNASTGTWHILLTSYDCNGNMRFAKLLESYATNFCFGLNYNAGKLYVSGTLYNNNKRIGIDTTINGYNYLNDFVCQIDTTGKYKWIRFVGVNTLASFTKQKSYGTSAIDGLGNIHLFAYLLQGADITNTITAPVSANYDIAYDANGALLSANRLQLFDSSYTIQKVEIDKITNKYYALFQYSGSDVGRTNNILSNYNANGSLIWLDSVSKDVNITGFRLKQGDGIYFTGYANGGGSTYSIGGISINNSYNPVKAFTVVGKLDLLGKAKWIKHIGGSNAIVGFNDIEVLPDYTLVCVGLFAGVNKYLNDSLVSTIAEGQNPMYFNIDTTGMLIDWEELHGSAFYDNGYVVTSDKIGNVYLGGYCSTDMYAGTLPKYISNGGNSDFFIMKKGYDCDCTAPAFPTASFNYTIVDSAARKVKFTYTGTSPKDSIIWQLGDGTIKKADTFTYQYAAVDTYTVCLRVNVHCGRKKICKDIIVPFKDGGSNSVALLLGNKNIEVYPNPANEKLYINGTDNNTTMALYDMMGKTVYKSISGSDHETIDISSMANGNYILLLTDNNGNRASKRIVKQ